jgi:hypothetical protein
MENNNYCSTNDDWRNMFSGQFITPGDWDVAESMLGGTYLEMGEVNEGGEFYDFSDDELDERDFIRGDREVIDGPEPFFMIEGTVHIGHEAVEQNIHHGGNTINRRSTARLTHEELKKKDKRSRSAKDHFRRDCNKRDSIRRTP